MLTKIYRIRLARQTTYSETEQRTIDYQKATKENKRILINFIRSYYQGECIRNIINGTYKAIFNNGFLVGVQYELKAPKKIRKCTTKTL